MPGTASPSLLRLSAAKYVTTAFHERDLSDCLSVDPRRITVSYGSVAQSRSMRSP